MSHGDRVSLSGITGTVVEVWPDGSSVRVRWGAGQSEIAGRTLWCPTWMARTEQ